MASSIEQFPEICRTPGMEKSRPCRTVVFHHIPKTAGSTFRRMLEMEFGESEVCPYEIDDEIRGMSDKERSRYRFFAGHFSFGMISEELADDATWLTFLRDPVARTVSNFFNVTDPARFKHQWVERARQRPDLQAYLERIEGISLEEYVFDGDPRTRDRVSNRMTRYLVRSGGDEMSVPDPDQLPLYEPDLVAEAKKNLEEKFAFVGIQENFSKSLLLLSMTFGMLPFRKDASYTANRNPTKSGDGRYDLPQNVREELDRQNQMDRELYSFGCELLERRLAEVSSRMVAEPGWELFKSSKRLGRARGRSQSVWNAGDHSHARGFHRAESDGHGRMFRWTGLQDPGELAFGLRLDRGCEVVVEVDVLSTHASLGDDPLGVAVNGVVCSRRDSEMVGPEVEATLVFTREVESVDRRFSCQLVELFAAAAPENDHTEARSIGCAVREVRLRRAETGGRRK